MTREEWNDDGQRRTALRHLTDGQYDRAKKASPVEVKGWEPAKYDTSILGNEPIVVAGLTGAAVIGGAAVCVIGCPVAAGAATVVVICEVIDAASEYEEPLPLAG